MMRIVCHLLWIATLAAASAAAAQDTSCCTIVGLDVKRQLITAIERVGGKLFRFSVKDAAIFKTARLCETFDAPLAETKKDLPLAADFGKADPKKPCCTLTTEVGGAGKTLGVRKYEMAGVDVILTEGCVGMGCTYTPAYGMHLLDGATRQTHPMLKDDRGYVVADLHPESKLLVGPNQIFTTWAKFNAPPVSSTVVTVVIPGTTQPFEDVPID